MYCCLDHLTSFKIILPRIRHMLEKKLRFARPRSREEVLPEVGEAFSSSVRTAPSCSLHERKKHKKKI